MTYKIKYIPEEVIKSLDLDWREMIGGSLDSYDIIITEMTIDKFNIEVDSNNNIRETNRGDSFSFKGSIVRTGNIEFGIILNKKID